MYAGVPQAQGVRTLNVFFINFGCTVMFSSLRFNEVQFPVFLVESVNKYVVWIVSRAERLLREERKK
jgi:hypothetical protein